MQDGMRIGLAHAEDYAGIDRVQAANIGADLSPEQRLSGGFLSARFSLAQIAAMAEDLGIVVAREGDVVRGFLCASRRDFSGQPPIIHSMLAQLPALVWKARALDTVPLFIYGPVCIDASQRGKGLLRKMFEALKMEMSGRFEAGVAFVAENNPHSLQAHLEGLGMADVWAFEHQHGRYRILVFAV